MFAKIGSQPGTPLSPGIPGGLIFPKGDDQKDDPAQEFIRARQKQAEEEKKRLLAAYDYISRQGAGPKTVVLEELRRVDSKFQINLSMSHIEINH